jgi:hypothetical protein
MDEFWGITILLFIVLSMFVAFILRLEKYWRRNRNTPRHAKVLLSDSMAGLKSGDIILFIGNTHTFINSTFTGDLYEHGSMVYRDGEGELFISESCVQTRGENTYEGSRMSPLVGRLEDYPGSVYLMRLAEPLTKAQEDTLHERVLEVLPYPSLKQMLLAAFSVSTHTQARHCMQHVAWLVDEMGLTPTALVAEGKTLLETGFFNVSLEVTSLPGKSLGGANSYQPIRMLLCDLACAAPAAGS